MTRLLYTLGTGNKCFNMLTTLQPKVVVKLLKIRCGQISGILGSFSSTSCLNTTFCSPKQTVGPTGKWQTIIPSGCPLCQCKTIISVKFLFLHKSTKSSSTQPPLLILSALGMTIAISFKNWSSLEEGSLDVVIRICGSVQSMLEYQSSMWVRGTIQQFKKLLILLASLDWSYFCSCYFYLYSSVGMWDLFCWAQISLDFFRYFSFYYFYFSNVYKYSRLCLMFFLNILYYLFYQFTIHQNHPIIVQRVDELNGLINLYKKFWIALKSNVDDYIIEVNMNLIQKMTSFYMMDLCGIFKSVTFYQYSTLQIKNLRQIHQIDYFPSSFPYFTQKTYHFVLVCFSNPLAFPLQIKRKILISTNNQFFLNQFTLLNPNSIQMAEFSVQKADLIYIISLCQQRRYAEEVQELQKHGNNTDWLISGLITDPKKGIETSEPLILMRKSKYGTNEKLVKQPPGFWSLFCQALEDFTLRILIVASIVSIAIQVGTADNDHRSTAWIEGFAVLVAVAISATVTAVNDYQKQRQFMKLNSVIDERKRVSVIRNGQLVEMHQDFVLVGDIVQINEGMQIPADGILLQANEITTDESAMTGEIDPIHKNTLENCIKKKQELERNGQKNPGDKHEVPSPIIMGGTRVLSGEGKLLILVVGDSSCIGKIRALLAQEQVSATPLQMKLQKIAHDIGKFGLYSAITIVVILLIRFAIEKGISKDWSTGRDLTEILNYFILGVTVIVVAIPEGLPLAVTLSLAFSVKKMLNDQNLVRKMQACETMGGANNICSDKTGTLTMNKMTLTTIWNGSLKKIDVHNKNLRLQHLTSNQNFLQLFKIAKCVNGTALLRPQQKGSATQIAILKYLQKVGVNYEDYRRNFQPKFKFPFSSSRKRMSVVVDLNGQTHIFVKGASQMVLGTCSQWLSMQSGLIEPITFQVKQKMQSSILEMANKSLRTLCIAYKKISEYDDLITKDEKGVFQIQKSNLILLAIIGVQDIPRPQVPHAIAQCHTAGIKVRMVTGDNIVTARAIAKDVGILKEQQDQLVMQGADFIKLVGGVVCKKCKTPLCDCARTIKQSQEKDKELRVDTIANGQEFDKLKDKLLVLARSRPEDKYALVTGLKQRGQVVAVTGDGTNDGPALKKADVGFAMGIAGTEVARESAAIILLDDNFNSIVKAVMWGRNIYDCIRKFIQFQLTVNVVAVTITLIGAALIKQQILKPIQMLWVNLIMDTLGSLALATQPPTQQVLTRQPHSRDQYIISPTMFKHILGQAIFQVIVMMTLVFAGQKLIPQYPDAYDSSTFLLRPDCKWKDGIIGGNIRSGRMKFVNGSSDYENCYRDFRIFSRHFTFIFNTFVMMQVFNFINAKKLHEELNIFEGITRNWLFLVMIAVIVVLQIILVTFTGMAFGVYSNFGLTIQQWGISILIGSFGLIVNFFLKLLPIGKGEIKSSESPQSSTKIIDVRNSSVLKNGSQRADMENSQIYMLGK